MRNRKESKKKNGSSSSPLRDRTSPSRFEYRRSGSQPSTSLLDQHLITDETNLSPDDTISDYNPRAFPYSVKQKCWDKAEKIKGRDPDRWRRDALGNIVFRKLVGCPGCLCHDYDHILPYSKATVNRSKGNRTEISRAELIQKSSYCRVGGRDMDLLELSAYGNVHRGQNSGGCSIQ